MSDEENNVIATKMAPFLMVPYSVLNDPTISGNARSLFLLMMSKPYGWKFNHANLGKSLGLSVRSIQTYLTELCKAGYLAKEQRVIKGKFSVNEYKFLKGYATEQNSPQENPQVTVGKKTYTDPASPSATKPSAESCRHINIDIKQNKHELRTPIIPLGDKNDFQVFWDHWVKVGKRIGRDKCEKLWSQLKPDLPVLLKAINLLKDHNDIYDQALVFRPDAPHPATWLRNKRWNDELDLDAARKDISRQLKLKNKPGTVEAEIFDPNSIVGRFIKAKEDGDKKRKQDMHNNREAYSLNLKSRDVKMLPDLIEGEKS